MLDPLALLLQLFFCFYERFAGVSSLQCSLVQQCKPRFFSRILVLGGFLPQFFPFVIQWFWRSGQYRWFPWDLGIARGC